MSSYSELFRAEGEEISKLGETIDANQIDQLLAMIGDNRHNIFVTGCGTSAMAARKIVHTLNVIGLAAFYLNPSDAVHGGLGQIRNDDVVIFISKGGSTKELTSFVNNCIDKKAKIIAITENTDSILAKDADLVVCIKVDRELDEFNMLATNSTLAVISLFDVVATVIMKKENFTKENFLMNHPSGKVGQQLAEDVKHD
ncbi:KpsF/GutQ family sugar-phosphate isomerase [Xylocopilactobacillus apis]|uniref:Sugar isomerase n=1 Tax=Xylocopilactobacillus apis TaxID=2932183 RepID=A0AAU9CSS6_9LACO|nr:SIS domain-containing protein [Xylocopilactobacillus apis]BDR57044.1 sugar isomerase [Xylocopilactobacillus apis]